MQISEMSCKSVRDHADQCEIMQITRRICKSLEIMLEIIKVTC